MIVCCVLYLVLSKLISNPFVPTALMRQVMQSPPSVCPSVCFHPVFGNDWPLMLKFCMWVGHDHSSQENLKFEVMSRLWVRLMRSVRPRSTADFFLVVVYKQFCCYTIRVWRTYAHCECRMLPINDLFIYYLQSTVISTVQKQDVGTSRQNNCTYGKPTQT